MTTRSLRIVESEAIGFRRTWRGSIISTFLNPVLFLAGMGIALGSLVDARAGSAQLPLPFVTFVASGLLAATAMQTGFGGGSWPVMAGLKWRKTFDSIIATPVSVADLVTGRALWEAIHLAFTLGVYAAVAVVFDALEPGRALLALGPAVLTGVAFQTASTAFTCRIEDETSLSSVMRFVIVPLFLFSGTFFPVSQLPDLMEPLAMATPLFHGVEMVRKLALPELVPPVVSSLPLWAHAGYLVAMTALGWYLSVRFLTRRVKQ
jgi:lipooligosaccharide transport system permease protein